MKEGEKYDKKSLSTITGKNPAWKEITKDCVGFANARGGIIAIGIEDKEDLPPLNQKLIISKLTL
jgi:ATP-dependent DNA helicase RecG